MLTRETGCVNSACYKVKGGGGRERGGVDDSA